MNKVYDTPEAINGFRIRTLRSALRLETKGMKKRGQSAYSIIKDEFGFKGNKESVLNQLNSWMLEHNIRIMEWERANL